MQGKGEEYGNTFSASKQGSETKRRQSPGRFESIGSIGDQKRDAPHYRDTDMKSVSEQEAHYMCES